MIRENDLVLVKEPWIVHDHHVFQAKVVQVLNAENHTMYLLEFENGTHELFEEWQLKTE